PRFLHGQVRGEELRGLAGEVLGAGTDRPAIRSLAGLTQAALGEADELFRRALQGLGRRRPTGDEAAMTVARHLSAVVLADPANARRVASEGARLAAAFNYHDALIPFYRADDEYGLPGCRPADVDRELVEYARRLLRDESRPVGARSTGTGVSR